MCRGSEPFAPNFCGILPIRAMREDVLEPAAAGVDEYSPTVLPTVSPTVSPQQLQQPASEATCAATGVPGRAAEAAGDALLGLVIAGRYHIERHLGAGGMGAVYLGTHITLGKKVAIKVIAARLGADPAIAQRFVQEARAASAIGHEHIVQITDFGSLPPPAGSDASEGGSFLVMEYLEGEDLAATLRRDGPMPWTRVVHIGEQIAWALAAAHKNDIVHRDIKPANCFRVPREQDPDFIKVLDFGLAKDLGEHRRDGESLTHTGMLLGTPGYIAPELYRGLKADHRVDIYSLGALMHKLLSGELPSMGDGEMQASLRELPAPAAVVAVLGKALRESPDQRHGSAQELAQALRALLRAALEEPTLPGGPPLPAADRASPPPLADGAVQSEPGSAPGLVVREPTPTPTSFSSLVTVERDGHKLRLSLGAPAFLMLMAFVGLTVYLLTRRDGEDPGRADRNELSQAPDPVQVAAPVPAPIGVVAATPDEAATAVPPGDPVVPPGKPVAPPWSDPVAPAAPASEPMIKTKVELKLPKGTTRSLGKLVTRQCARDSSFHYEIGVSWSADAEGLIRRDSVVLGRDQPQTVSKNVKDCVLLEVKRSKFQWQPDEKYAVRIEVGKRPAG